MQSRRRHPQLLVIVASAFVLVVAARRHPHVSSTIQRASLQRLAFVGNAKPRRETTRTTTPSYLNSIKVLSTRNYEDVNPFAMTSSSSRGNRGRIPALFSSFDSEDEDDDDDDDEVEMRSQSRRDRIKDWMYGSSGKPMVRPIRLDGRVDDERTPNPPRIRAKFDSLFAGMPSMEDIMSGDSSDDDEDDDDASRQDYGDRRRSKRKVDDSWFEAEKKQILANYEDILKGIVAKLKSEREQDPDSVPANAEAMIKSVLKQEMDTEIAETREKRIDEMLDAYEKEARFDADAVDVSDVRPNESVQRLIDESEAEYAQIEANRLEVQDFLRYEQEAVVRAKKEAAQDESTTASGITRPIQGENLDQWALDRLKEMVGALEDSDGDEMILDILQENVDELENRIKKQAGGTGLVKPETMKEWQMYRSIATRVDDDGNEEGEATEGTEKAREEYIMAQLKSWKEYVQKEEGIRKRSGLTRGPKLPFAWQESDLEAKRDAASFEPVATDKKSRIEARKRLNRMSIEAMESLLEKTDATRREKLQKEIDYLKATLEANDYLDIDESLIEDSVAVGPVDTTDLFQSYASSDDTLESSFASSNTAWDTSTMPPGSASYSDTSVGPPLPQKAPFWGDAYEDSSRPRTVPPPKTAFFDDVSEQGYEGETLTDDSRLGSMEEQKLEAMYRRAGARTTEERYAIRSQWEEFQEFEKGRRKQSGLSGDTEDVDEASSLVGGLKYNVSEVMREDGDFDAEAILATIGPRPVRKKKDTTDTNSAKKSASLEDGKVDDPSLLSAIEKEEVMDSLYRAVSAVGGGRYKDDPVAKAQQRASFEEFMEKEDKLRASLDDPNIQELVDLDDDLPSPTDVDYAEEVLSSLGPRPKPKRARIIDAGDFSDQGGVLASEGDDDEEDDDDDDNEAVASDEGDDGLIPEWLRMENEEARKRTGVRKSFLGNDIDEVFDDTDYEHNMRQLAEYEKRRAGNNRQIGIDISDVLGRSSLLDTADYADFKYDDDYSRDQRNGWGTGSFAARKANLLDYIELDVRELNALMDHKDSVYSTGVSQYLPRVNKPFKDFGAIFRLEGVLLNVNGLQLKAWRKVAEEYGFKNPSFDDVKQAAVTRPEVAVKDIFFWTDDFLECKNVAASHRQAFKEVFTAWAKEEGITIPELTVAETTKGNLAIGGEVVRDKPRRIMTRPASEAEKLDQLTKAWKATAEEYGKAAPGHDAIIVAATVSPDIAIIKAFKWSSDPLEVDKIVQSFRKNLLPESEKGKNDDPSASVSANLSRGSTQLGVANNHSPKPRTETDVMELHYQAWYAMAESYGFNPPDADEVLAAFVINEPEIAARGFGWSEEPQILSNVASAFRVKLEELKNDGRGAIIDAQSPIPSKRPISSQPSDAGPNRDELFKVALEAWSATARRAGYSEPDNEQVLFALSVGPEEAIVTGFDWTSDPNEVAKLVQTYRDEIGRRRSSWQASGAATSQAKPTVPTRPTEVKPSGPSADEVYRAVFDSWTAVAAASGFSAPDDEQVQFAMSVGPEEAIINGFVWTDDSTKVAELIEKYFKEIAQRRSKWQVVSSSAASRSTQSGEAIPMFQVSPGAAAWVKSLLDVEMQCGVVSYLEREQVDVLLQLAGLDHLIPPDKRTSATNGYVTDKDQLLGAALRVERRPDHCVVFDTNPYASVAAHDVEMQSVGLIGPYPRYELLSADTTAATFDDLTAMNIRRLFSERVYDQPLADAELESAKRRNTKTRTRTFFDDD